MAPLKTVLPVRLMLPLLILPDKVSVLAEMLLTSKVPLTVIGAEMVSPTLVESSTRVAGDPELSNVRVPPLGARVKIPPPEPRLNEPTVMA